MLAVATATVAAWWPARVVSRAPVTEALSGRPPTPRPARRSAIVAIGCIVAGTAGLASGIDTVHDKGNPVLVLPSILLLVMGMLLISPVAIGALAACASRLPVATRLALRDLGRYRARSGTALAAISLSLGLAMAIVLAAQRPRRARRRATSDRQVLFRLGDEEPFVPVRSPEEIVALEDAVARFAATLDEGGVLALDAVADPAIETIDGHARHPIAILAWPVTENTNRDIDPLYVATRRWPDGWTSTCEPCPPTPMSSPDRSAASCSSSTWRIRPSGASRCKRSGSLRRRTPPCRARLMTPAQWSATASSPSPRDGSSNAAQPLTDAQRGAARRVAAAAGLTAEVRDEQGGLGTLRQSATAAGALFALAVLAMTVGLIRGESGRDLRTLTASGATSATRRTLTAATAGGWPCWAPSWAPPAPTSPSGRATPTTSAS